MRGLLLLTFTLFLCAKQSRACNCDYKRAITTEELNQTSYIALVKVTDIFQFQFDTVADKHHNPVYKITIEEISLYKGKSTKEILVRSGHPKFKTWTSCDLGIDKDQEWIVFASSLNDVPIIYPCGRSMNYRAGNGLRDWKYKKGFEEIAFLDSAFNRPATSSDIKKGALHEYFPNGQLERSENFKKWQRHGSVEYFYPDGQVYGRGNYQKGKPTKKFTWYYEDGTIMLSENYDNGRKIDSTVLYSRQSNGTFPFMVLVYSKKGKLIFSRTYSGLNSLPYVSNEFFFDPVNKKSVTKYYFDNGQISSVQTVMNGQMEYIEYERNGDLRKKTRQSIKMSNQ